MNLIKLYESFICGFILTNYNCGWILFHATVKKATWVAETCRWALHNKLTFIHSRSLVGLFLNKNLLSVCARSPPPPPNPSMHLTSSHTCYFTFPSSYLWCVQPSNICLVLIMKFIVMQCIPVSCYTLFLHARGPPLFCCPQLLIRHIDSHHAYLEAVSSLSWQHGPNI